jgi:hypothetical protein
LLQRKYFLKADYLQYSFLKRQNIDRKNRNWLQKNMIAFPHELPLNTRLIPVRLSPMDGAVAKVPQSKAVHLCLV